MTRRAMSAALALLASAVYASGVGGESRNPFGFADVVNLDGEDVAQFADSVSLSQDDRDANATLWTNKTARGLRGSPDGQWAGRWSGGNAAARWSTGTATVATVGERVYIFFQDEGSYLIEARREGNRLIGRYVNTRDPSDTAPWFGVIVSDERIDGAWGSGRWDFRRRLSPITVAATAPVARRDPPTDPTGYNFGQQIGFAREWLRSGHTSEAAYLVRGSLSARLAPSTGDSRDLSLARALVHYADGDLRAAYDDCTAIHAAAKPGQVNIDAGLLKSLIFLRKGVYSPAAQWREWSAAQARGSVVCDGIKELLDEHVGKDAAFKLVQSGPHGKFTIDVFRGSDLFTLKLTIVVRQANDFRGAFVLRTNPLHGDYEFHFHDLEGAPLVLANYGQTRPSEDALVAYVKRFDPSFGNGRFSVMRAELEALYWQRADVAPYAAQWAKRAEGSSLIHEQVSKPLQAAQRWTWELSGNENRELDATREVEIQTYVNSELPKLSRWNDRTERPQIEQALHGQGPLEHIHYVIVTPQDKNYLGSIVLESSEPSSGERIYYLSSIFDGQRERRKRFDGDIDLARIPGELKQLMEERRGWIGIPSLELTTKGVKLQRIAAGPAKEAGLAVGDIILSISGHEIASVEDFVAALKRRRSGEKVDVVVERGGQQRAFSIVLASRPTPNP